MNNELPVSAQMVQNILKKLGSHLRVQLIPSTTATAYDAATVLGVEVSQIGKSIAFEAGTKKVVVVLPGDHFVDLELLCTLLKETKVKKLSAKLVKESLGFSIGGVSPVGLPNGTVVIVDNKLKESNFIFIAAGHPHAVVKMDFRELLRISGAMSANISTSIRPGIL